MGVLFSLVKVNDSDRRKIVDRIGFSVKCGEIILEMYYDKNKCLLNIKSENKYIREFAKALLRTKNREEIDNDYSINFVRRIAIYGNNNSVFDLRHVYKIESNNLFIEELDNYNA